MTSEKTRNERIERAGLARFGKMLKVISLASIVLVAVLLTGCSKRYSDLPAFMAFPLEDSYNYSVGRFKTSHLAEQIHAYYRGNSRGPIAVATFVDIDNLYGSSTFGRMLSEQLMSELSMLGYNVIELRQSQALQVLYDQGEFALSRDVSTLRGQRDVAGIVVGTYVVSPVRVYINARLIDPVTSLVISAGSVEMSKTDEMDRMLRASTMPPTLERIPVRNLSLSSVGMPGYFPSQMPPMYYGPRRWADELENRYPSAPPVGAPTLDVPKPAEPVTPPAPKLEEEEKGS